MSGRYVDEYGGIDIYASCCTDVYTNTDSLLKDISYNVDSYKYQFKNEEDLITSEIFQKCLGQSLAHKDKIIKQLQEDLLNDN